jgi:hypothetical protein
MAVRQLVERAGQNTHYAHPPFHLRAILPVRGRARPTRPYQTLRAIIRLAQASACRHPTCETVRGRATHLAPPCETVRVFHLRTTLRLHTPHTTLRHHVPRCRQQRRRSRRRSAGRRSAPASGSRNTKQWSGTAIGYSEWGGGGRGATALSTYSFLTAVREHSSRTQQLVRQVCHYRRHRQGPRGEGATARLLTLGWVDLHLDSAVMELSRRR